MQPHVLVVDDDPAIRRFVETGLAERGVACRCCSSAEEGLDVLASHEFSVVVSDVRMSGMSGIDLCRRISQDHPNTPIVVITAFGEVDTAVAAIRAGAYDFITKPLDLDALKLTIDRAVQHRQLRDEVRRLQREAGLGAGFEGVVGASQPMNAVRDLLGRIADSDASVLITGESGTGKEVAARALHLRSPRRSGPFVPVNCAAIPESLLESELFGHAKGAFTDAKTARTGLLVQSTGGTLFLDEIGDMPLSVQPKLLRAIQERTVRPVGSDFEVAFDARIVAATHRDIESAVEERRFREDLYFRINVIHVEMPPLRSRGGDVLLLAQRFFQSAALKSRKNVTALSPAAAEKLIAYPWPGNVRELMNCIERSVALARDELISVEDLPERVRSYNSSHVIVTSDDPSDLVPLEEVERRYIQRVLEAVGGNKSVAARVLGVDRKTLYRKLDRHGLRSAADGEHADTDGPPSSSGAQRPPGRRS